MNTEISVLRLSHRIERDKRISSHCALAARAFGAKGMVYSGQRDASLEVSVRSVVKNWGGDFTIQYIKDPLGFIRDFRGLKTHLTIYGLPFQNLIPKIRKTRKPVLVIVGGEKVRPEVYRLADFNLSVTQQPHSEVSGLCLFLDYYFRGRELSKRFPNARLRVVPQERGKRVLGE